jgi:hypothetical protein
MIQSLYQTEGLTIQHDTTQGWLLTIWEGVQSEQSVQGGCTQILQRVRSTGSTQILHDGSQDYDGWNGIVQWISHNFFPQLTESGITSIAWVVPHNLRARAAMDKLIAQVASPEITTFNDIELAHAWLCKHRRAAC